MGTRKSAKGETSRRAGGKTFPSVDVERRNDKKEDNTVTSSELDSRWVSIFLWEHIKAVAEWKNANMIDNSRCGTQDRDVRVEGASRKQRRRDEGESRESSRATEGLKGYWNHED